jgi:hypothetical protein
MSLVLFIFSPLQLKNKPRDGGMKHAFSLGPLAWSLTELPVLTRLLAALKYSEKSSLYLYAESWLLLISRRPGILFVFRSTSFVFIFKAAWAPVHLKVDSDSYYPGDLMPEYPGFWLLIIVPDTASYIRG